MVRFTTRDGELEKKELTIVGRKFPLLDIRNDLLHKHENYMRLTSDEEIAGLSLSDLSSLVAKFDQNLATTANSIWAPKCYQTVPALKVFGHVA